MIARLWRTGAVAVGLALVGASGCVPAGAGPADAMGGDTGTGPGDAGICPGKVHLQGQYEVWDSTPTDFRGIAMATVTVVGSSASPLTTPPNGRVSLCLDPGVDRDILFTHSDYKDFLFSASAQAAPHGMFSAHGLTPAQANDKLGTIWQAGTALVLVEVRRFLAQAPGGEPVPGTTVRLGGGAAGAAYTWDESPAGPRQGDTTGAADVYVLFVNVAVGSGDAGAAQAQVAVTPPGGTTCTGRQRIALRPDALVQTTYACQ